MERLPTKSEFEIAKNRFIQAMDEIIGISFVASNPNVNEVVAFSHFGINDGYKSLLEHWRDSEDVQNAVLSSNAPSEIFVFVDAEGGLWPYCGKVDLRKKSVEIEHDYLCTTDRDIFIKESEDSIVYELYGTALKIMSKFYRTELVYVGYTGSCGSVFDWANYNHATNELLSYELINESESFEHFSFAMDSDFAIIKLVKK